MKKDIKIIFFDIDGTLVDMKTKCITEKMLETLRSLHERKIILCLATGRSPISLPHFEGVSFDVFLTYNGSYCYNHERTILSRPIPTADVKNLIRNAQSLQRPAALASKGRIAANGKDQDLIDYFAFAKQTVNIADDFETFAEEEIYQVMLGCREDDYPQLMHNVLNAKITAWWDRAVDIIPAASGKGVGIEKILEYYQLDRSHALAFGDGNNDLEMLQAVGWGVAMGNASEALKAIADEVCGSAAEDGIYHYCLEHDLI